MATQSSGYHPTFHMPIIGPPPPGEDPTTYYNEVTSATAVQVTAADHQGLYIELSNAAYSQLFAMTGGLIRFIPAGDPLPIPSQELVQGAGALVLQTWVADFDKLKSDLPPGVPAMTSILYLNVQPDAVRTALTPHVQALKDAVLKGAWNKSSEPANRAELETNYLDLLFLGESVIFVPGGTLIGEAAGNTPDPASDRVLIFRFIDSAGNDLSPILHLRSMESYGGPQWHDHPLIQAVSNIPVPVNIYLQFEKWNGANGYEPLPAGVAVHLMDWDPPFDSDPLKTEFTDDQGCVHFSTSLEELAALDPDDAEIDLYFLVHTSTLTHAGQALPDEWSTKGWKSTDGSPGYYENFSGSQLGEAASPLVFRIGLDFHVKFSYEDRSHTETVTVTYGSPIVIGTNTEWKLYLAKMRLRVSGDSTDYTILQINESAQTMILTKPYTGGSGSGRAYTVCVNAIEGIPVTLMIGGVPRQFLHTDQTGSVSGIVFDIEGEDTVHFLPSFEITPLTNHHKVQIDGWRTVHTAAEGLYLPDNQLTSIGTHSSPYSFCYDDDDRCAAFYILKVLKELSTFLSYMTLGQWTGVPALKVFLTSIVNHAYSWPVGEVNLPSSDHFNRRTIIHEVSHQVMWKEAQITSSDVGDFFVTGRLWGFHFVNSLANPKHALIEGWANFMAAVFCGFYPYHPGSYDVSTLYDFWTTFADSTGIPIPHGPPIPLGPPPVGQGESVEGAFANGLWGIFNKFVVAASSSTVPESADGDITPSLPWITDAAVLHRFRDMIWEPLKDLALQSNPSRIITTTKMIDNIRLRNAPLWHALQAELQAYNMAMDVPSITSISPSSGPKAGGQSVTISGAHFVAGMSVRIGGQPATNLVVSSSTTLTAVTPGSAAVGSVDVVVETNGGSSTLLQGYTYQ